MKTRENLQTYLRKNMEIHHWNFVACPKVDGVKFFCKFRFSMIFDRLNSRIHKREIERAKAERDDYLARKEAECAILREKSGNETIFITVKMSVYYRNRTYNRVLGAQDTTENIYNS